MASSLFRIATAGVSAALFLLPAGAAHAATPASAHATPAEAAQLLFVAGGVRRLERTPSGTVDTVLEQTLQQVYRDEPELAPDSAEAEVRALYEATASGGAATSPATLAVMPGNQRVIAIIAALKRSTRSARAGRALTRLADRALTEASTSSLPLGRRFNPNADTVSTLLYGSFSPAATLRATWQLARDNRRFGEARDVLWEATSEEGVYDDARELVLRNPELHTDAVQALTSRLAADGSVTVPVSELEALARSGLGAIGAQTTEAIAQHRDVMAACPGDGCEAARERAKADDPASRAVIVSQNTALNAVAGLLARVDSDYGAAIGAEAQAATQVAASVNAYFSATDYGLYFHIAADVVGLGASLAVAVVNPAAAVTGVLTVVGDIVGVALTGPDANALILQGLQGVSQQLSAFAAATAAQFRGVDARLEALTREVATLGQQLSTQIAEAQAQIMTLGDSLARLQGSVDRLQEEIRLLFEANARNDLRTLTSQTLGYEQLNERPLGQEAFASAAAALLTDAMDASFSDIVLRRPGTFDALAAAGLGGLDPSINFFALFPGRRADSPAGIDWPGALNSTCADADGLLCLPSPDFWATSSRALSQLLLENRRYATAGRLTEVDAALMPGRALAGALGRISANDTGERSGSRLLNASLDYYGSWLGRDADRPSGPPTLLQAVREARRLALEPQRVDGVLPLDQPWIDPWGGVDQPLGGVSLFNTDAFARIANDRLTGGAFTLGDVRPAEALLTRQPRRILNAIRLGIGRVVPTWDATFVGNVGSGQRGTLDVSFRFTYRDNPTATDPDGFHGSLGTVTTTIPNALNCTGVGDGNDAARIVVKSWTAVPVDGCPPVASEVNAAALRAPTASQQQSVDRVLDYVTPRIDARLHDLQGPSLSALVASDGGLTHGAGQPSDVAAAAQRLTGARGLAHGYVALGFPQALATDDALRSLIAGDALNLLANPYGDRFRRPEPAPTLPGQVANFFRLVAEVRPPEDPLIRLGVLLNVHRASLERALEPYVKTGRARDQDPADGGRLSQLSPLVASTIDRLELTRAVLADSLVRRPSPPAPTPTPTPTPVPTSTPSPEAASPAPQVQGAGAPAAPPAAARARLIGAPRLRGRAVTLTVGCDTGTCRFVATAKAGRPTVTRRFSLAAGTRRTVSLRLPATRSRTVAVRVTVAGSATPLVTRTLRRPAR
jgi:hypothetical protein